MQYQKKQGFTLVELIVVITIVGILSTVGFVSYSGYLSGARDSNRMSQMVKISDSLQVYSASKTLPLPDDAIDITASGASNVVAYQGYVGVDVLETIDYTNGGQDPKDGSYYTYMLTKDRKSLQLLAMMEEQQSVTSLNMLQARANYEERFPKVYGRKLGILTYNDDSDTTLFNTPAQEISANAGGLDIVTTGVAYTSHITDSSGDKITGTGASLSQVNPKSSCKRIKQTGGASGNGIYTISPAGTGFQVYCEMETNGGGWTEVASTDDGALDIPAGIIYEQVMIYSENTGETEVIDTIPATLTVGSYTLASPVITGGTANDGLNGETGKILVK